MKDDLIPIATVAHLVGVAPITINRWTGRGVFPRPVTLGPKTKRWERETVIKWINERKQDREHG